MHRRLIVMRHAKSSWDSDTISDHDRSLNHRGRTDAPRIANQLTQLGWTPDYVLSSDSERTRETYQRMFEYFNPPPESNFLRSLYHAGVQEFCTAVSQLADDFTTALVLGHNPGWEHVVHWLADQSITMTTANAALLEGPDLPWFETVIHPAMWQLAGVIRPKEL